MTSTTDTDASDTDSTDTDGTAPSVRRIVPRRVRFDFADTPLHWLPGDPQTTHTINVLHLLLPAGEKWFVDVYRQALPLITDPQLRDDVKGFMGQEAVHSRAHAAVLDHLKDQGLDPAGYTKFVDWMFDKMLADRPFHVRAPFLAKPWLMRRLAIIAAVEHFTAVLGCWIIENEALEHAGADPVMLDLLRWHGAEEVEHRSVAFDLFEHVSGSRLNRITSMLITVVALTVLWATGVRYFLANDPQKPAKGRWLGYHRAAKRGLLPPERDLLRAVPRYLRRDHHPSQEGSTELALAYLAVSPAAHAASSAA